MEALRVNGNGRKLNIWSALLHFPQYGWKQYNRGCVSAEKFKVATRDLRREGQLLSLQN
jgi:hypothetical protein